MSEESIENKQKYLRENILEAGYDPEEFMAYCENQAGQIDLQGWSLGKLKKIVDEFVVAKTSGKSTTQEQEDQWTDFHEPMQMSSNEHQKVQHKHDLVFNDEDWGLFGISTEKKQSKNEPQFSVSPPTFPSQPQVTTVLPPIISQTSKKNQNEANKQKQFKDLKVEDVQNAVSSSNKILKTGEIRIPGIKAKELPPLPAINDITILKTEQKTRNFLQGDYTLYHIKFSPCNHIIQRKFNDFRKLRVILHKLYPNIRMPYLEPEGWLVNSSEGKDPDTLGKYKYMVVEFLKYITMRNEVLRKSKIVRIFVGMIESNPADFKKYQNIAKPKTFSDLCLGSGHIQINNYQSLVPIDKYMTNSHLLLGEIDTYYEKLKKNLDTLFYNYQNVAKSLLDVSNIFDSLQNLIQKFNFDNDTKKEIRVYEGIKEVCLRMKENMEGHYSIFKNKVQPLFKYERENMGTIKEVNDVRNKMFNEFVRQGLHTKPYDFKKPKDEVIEVVGNMSIEEPARNNKNQLAVQNTFWAHFTLENMENYWKQLRYKINEQLTLIAYDELDNENENLNFWNMVIKKCVI